MRRRAVIVRRPTEFDELMDRYSTRGQVEFVLRSRGRTLESVECAHEAHVSALAHVRAGIPDGWASADVERDSLSRFLFAPEDVIVVVGPDGLVANVAKYAGDRPWSASTRSLSRTPAYSSDALPTRGSRPSVVSTRAATCGWTS